VNVDRESQAIWDVRLAVEDALRREDTKALMKLWAEDSTFYVPNAGMFTGKEEIQKAHEVLFNTYDDIEFKFKRLAINFPTPDIAIEDVNYVFTATDLQSNGRDVTVLAKRDGRWLITAVLDLIPLAPTGSVTEEAVDNSKRDIEAIHRRENEFLAAHAFNDGAKLAEFYTDDALLIPPDEPIVSGKQAITEWYQNEFKKAPPTENPSVNLDDIEIRGDLAFLRGNFILKFKGQTEDQPIIQNLRFISIWRKTLDGIWKFYRDIWNIQAPPSPRSKDLTIVPSHQFEHMPTGNPTKVSGGVCRVGCMKACLPNDQSDVQMVTNRQKH
jgi:uncharacterized protein (TIGR02246 family)